MEIRYLEDFDKSGICKLSHQINSEHYKNEPQYFCKPVVEGEDWGYWKNSHEKNDGFVLVAILNNEVVGFISAELAEMPNLPFLNPMKRCRIATIVVSDNHHRKGIGSALYDRVREMAKEQGASDLTLEVFSFNRSAIAFYEKIGFRNTSNHMSLSLA
jgi:ribosomal protein S18 acetylase RimI-like enzyme